MREIVIVLNLTLQFWHSTLCSVCSLDYLWHFWCVSGLAGVEAYSVVPKVAANDPHLDQAVRLRYVPLEQHTLKGFDLSSCNNNY